MRQVVQNYRTGEVTLRSAPVPHCRRDGILVRNRSSLISIGTERSMIDLGRKSLVGKARARPDLVRRAYEKGRREGFWKTFQEALARLDTPTPLGYSCAGVVVEAGESAHGFAPGDRVACVGSGFASHAEFVSIPANMACKIPGNVSDEEAAFAMLGAIALHGVREAKLTFGASAVVLGLGLLGLVTVQLLRAYGCRVIAMDIDAGKAALARELGAEASATDSAELMRVVQNVTGGLGCDAVLIVAATDSPEPVNTAVAVCRPKGRIVVVGVADIHPDRNDMWQKEVEIVVSKAGGAGALDPLYELDGVDLPVAYARWTQGRNVEEFLRLASERRIDLSRLVTHRHYFGDAENVYASHLAGKATGAIGILFEYPPDATVVRSVPLVPARAAVRGKLRLGVIGAGQFGRTTLLPELVKAAGVELVVLATSSGITGEHVGRRLGFAECATDADAVFQRDDIDAIFALTPHSHHARAVRNAIQTGKHLFVEKPLCVTPEELDDLEAAAREAARQPLVMVGHNRRYSPHAARMRSWLKGRGAPLVMDVRVNAGFVPADHWVHAEAQGRSRIVGEMTHFLDLMETLADCAIAEVAAMRVSADDRTLLNNDNLAANLRFRDGSVGSLVYSAQGPRSYPREHVEIYAGEQAIVSTDFRNSTRYGVTRKDRFATPSQAYGYKEEIAHFVAAVRGETALVPDFGAAVHTMRAAFAIEASLASGGAVTVP